MRARNCNFVPIGTAWSTGSSFGLKIVCCCCWSCCFVWFFRWPLSARFALIRPMGGASLYSATSYSRRPGVSSTTPDTRAPCGLFFDLSLLYQSLRHNNGRQHNHIKYLQTAGESGRLVLDDRGLGRLAHDDQLLVRLHYDARELWKPNANVHKTL